MVCSGPNTSQAVDELLTRTQAFPGEDTSTIILSPVQPIAPGTTPDPQSIVDCLAAERSRTGITGRDVAERFRDTLNKQKLFTYALSIDTFNADNPTNLSDLSMTLKAMHKVSCFLHGH